MPRILQISDCHLGDTEFCIENGVNPYERLRLLTQHIKNHHPLFDLLLMTGDVASTGGLWAYKTAMILTGHLALNILWVPGNHDCLATMASQLGDSLAADITMIDLNERHRIVALSTQVEGQVYGMLFPDILDKLDTMLALSQHKRIGIAMHHPAWSVQSDWIDALKLQNIKAFWALIQRHNESFNNIDFIVSGHVHQCFEASLGAIRLWSSPSSAYQFEANQKECGIDSKQIGYRIIEWTFDRLNSVCYQLSAP